jgi:hypothetical protein
MSYIVNEIYTKEYIEEELKFKFEVATEDNAQYKGYFPKALALEIILNLTFCEEPWNKALDCPATNYTDSENFDFRYHLYSPTKRDVIYNPLKKEEALIICEKVLTSMVEKKLVVISKSGKGVKYIG